MHIKAILLSLMTIFMVSCQKENLTEKTNPNTQDLAFVKNVKKYYDLVKAANDNQIIERDGISLTLDEALLQIETLFSYAYGDFTIASDSTYSYLDTVVINFTSTPITTDDFVSLTNQVLDICKDQFDRITYTGPKYFYSVKMRKLSSTSTSATVSVRTVFGSKYNPINDFTPIGEWPTTVFDNKFTATYYNDRHTCSDPGGVYNSGVQAPKSIASMMNRYKSYLNYDPFYAISNGQPNPYVNMVLAGVQVYDGSSRRVRYPETGDEEGYTTDNNYWDWLLHQRNPDDVTLNDCIDEYNCFKIATGLNNEESNDCINNTRSKCLNVPEMNHYYNRLMSCVLETMNHYKKHHFIAISTNPFLPNSLCIDGIACSYWMSFSISLGNMYTVETKQEDKLTFPESI